MKSFFTIIISVFAFYSSFAQERTVSGRLTSTEDGSPLPGISITIKGTNIGTTTDADGYYSIRVPIGETLVFSFIGMQTKEVLVTETNLKPVTNRGQRKRLKHNRKNPVAQPIPSSLYSEPISKPSIGVAILTDTTPTYTTNQPAIDPTAIRSIKQKGNSYNIRTDTDPVRRTGFALQFTTSLGVDQINKLPRLQEQFSQGRATGNTVQWLGADQLEIFSWGPFLRTLEFDGTNYPFDRNGKLVPRGTGNGENSKLYDPLSFFRNGMVNINELMIAMPVPRNGTVLFDVEHRVRSGIIPNSQYRKVNVSANLKNLQITNDLSVNASVLYNRSTGDLLMRGANLASIVGSVYRTPVTFDNGNSLAAEASSNATTYKFSDGSKRSHAPGVADNPYGLVNELPDTEELHRLMATTNLQYQSPGPLTLVFNGSVDQQWNRTIFGLPPGYSGYIEGRLSDRKELQTSANAILTTAYLYDHYEGQLKVSLSYQADYSRRKLARMDGFRFNSGQSFRSPVEADSVSSLGKSLNRTAQEIVFNAQYEYGSWLHARITNRSYFSNTIDSKRYTNLLPSASISLDFADLLMLWQIDNLNLYAILSRTLREAPLLYSNWSYASTPITVKNSAEFFEVGELFFTSHLSPETERKFETGVKFRGGRFNAELNYYNNLTKDLITPVKVSDGFTLANAASIKNYGGNISAGYFGSIMDGRWGIDLTWTKYNSLVQRINTSDEWIPLAGFQNAQTVLSPGRPIGSIFGTTYVRNSDGLMVIGSDGFPIKDNNLKMIGSPIPDWNLGWSSYLQWKQFRLSFLFDFKKGGDIWNGTHAVLDYLGRSSTTAESRNTSNYIFEGVDVNGNTNMIAVDFYDRTRPISENRWVRYDWDGVGEDYVEDASWIRLSELILSYEGKHRSSNAAIKNLKISLIGRNLFLHTPYSGVDPTSALFGYAFGNGLDLFNVPSTRSYNIQVTVKL